MRLGLVVLGLGCIVVGVSTWSHAGRGAASVARDTSYFGMQEYATVTAEEEVLKSSSAADRAHIVFIMVDDMGYNDIGYSSTDIPDATPNLVSWARDGIILSRYYTQQSCTPARAAFLSGRYPANAGMGYDSRGSFVSSSPYGLPLKYDILPQYLRPYGYATYITGKWNIGHYSELFLPEKRGFDQFLTFQTDQIHYYNHTISPRVEGKLYVDLLDGARGHGWETGARKANYSTFTFTSRATQFIRDNGASKPMFLYVAYQAVHVPHETPPLALFNADEDGWKLGNVSYSYREKFGETLVALDNSLPDIIDALRGEGMLSRTFIVVASDNGGCPSDGSNNFPLRGGKFDVFEGGVRVPAFVYSELIPEHLRGTTLDHLVHVSDWLPTFVHLASMNLTTRTMSKVDLPGDLDGVSQLSSLMESGDSSEAARTETLIGLNKWQKTQFGELLDLPFSNTSGAVIVGEWKYIKLQSPREQYSPWTYSARDCECGLNNASAEQNFLFKITEDPYETTNLIDDYPHIAQRLLDTLHQHYLNATESVWETPQYTRAMVLWNKTGFVVPWSQT